MWVWVPTDSDKWRNRSGTTESTEVRGHREHRGWAVSAGVGLCSHLQVTPRKEDGAQSNSQAFLWCCWWKQGWVSGWTMGIEITQNEGKKNERFFSFYLTSRTFKAIKSGLFHFTNHRHRISAFTRTLLRTPVTLFGYPAKENGGSVRTESLRALHTRLFGPSVNIVFNLTLKAVSDSRL